MAIRTESDRNRIVEEFQTVEDKGQVLLRQADVFQVAYAALEPKLSGTDLTELQTRKTQLLNALKTALGL